MKPFLFSILSTFLALNIAYAGQNSYEVQERVLGIAELGEINIPSDKEDYVAISVQGKVDIPSKVFGVTTGIEKVERSGTVSFIQVRGAEFADKHCDISYCFGYFYFKGAELWIDVKVVAGGSEGNPSVLSYPLGFLDDNGDVNFFPIEGLSVNWTTDKYNLLEKEFGAKDADYPSIHVPATSLQP